MSKSGRSAFLVVLLTLLLGYALPALGTDESTDATEPPASEEAPAEEETVVTTDIEPAVPITPDTSEPALADWTYRYLVPTGIVLAILIILVTSARYFTNVVRKRYRIIEE